MNNNQTTLVCPSCGVVCVVNAMISTAQRCPECASRVLLFTAFEKTQKAGLLRQPPDAHRDDTGAVVFSTDTNGLLLHLYYVLNEMSGTLRRIEKSLDPKTRRGQPDGGAV